MATDTVSALSDIYKRRYKGELPKIFNDMTQSLNMAQQKTRDFSGGQETIACQVTRAGGTGGRDETQGFPVPGGASVVQGSVPLRRKFSVFQVSEDAISRSKGDEAAFAEVLGFELKTHMERVKKQMNIDFLLEGRGILGTVVTGGTLKKEVNETLQVTFDTTRYMEQNDIVAFWTNVTDTSSVLTNGGQSDALDKEQVFISSVDSSTKATVKRTAVQATGDATVATANAFRLYGEKTTSDNAGNQAMSGLRLFADDGTLVTSFQGISRTTYPRWQGQIISATAENLSRDHMYRLAHKIGRQSGTEMDTLIWDVTMLREHLATIQPDIRYSPVKDLDSGYAEESLVMTLGSRPVRLLSDWDAPFGTIYGFAKKHLFWYEKHGLHVDESTGSILKQATPHGNTGAGDVFYGYLRIKGNWAVDNAAAFGVVTGLNYSAE